MDGHIELCEDTGSLDYETHLSSEDASHRLHEGFSIRAFVGYSGWSEGQLESEIQRLKAKHERISSAEEELGALKTRIQEGTCQFG